MHPLSTELALRAFEADASFSTALAEFQSQADPSLNPVQAARAATAHGFSWLARPCGDGLIEVRLRHSGGADAAAEGSCLSELLAGLLGLAPGDETPTAAPLPLQQKPQAPEPVQIMHESNTAPDPDPVEVAAESLAAATGGTVVDAELEPTTPDPTTPLTAEQREAALQMVKAMDADQRKAFTISFRDAFRVDRSVKAIAPVIQQLQHLHFIDRFSVEANGGISE
jgi:hypothetical protein